MGDKMAQLTLGHKNILESTVNVSCSCFKKKEVSYLLVTNVKPWPHFICMADDGFTSEQKSFQLKHC